jgi:hypothetical protein
MDVIGKTATQAQFFYVGTVLVVVNDSRPTLKMASLMLHVSMSMYQVTAPRLPVLVLRGPGFILSFLDLDL